MSTQSDARAAETCADPRWAAVQARDATADGRFFYSVETTGVYCRPGCGARTPKPENVRFFPTAEAAEQAGFRPCKRCRPDQAPLAERQRALVAALCREIETASAPLSLDVLAQRAQMSRYPLHRLFKAVTGVTPKAYADAHRARRLREALDEDCSVTAALYEAGYNASSRFYEQADRVLGMTPRRYKAGGVAESIRFAVGQCSLGAILVAATLRGVCAIFLGDDPDALVRDLQDRFPHAELLGGEADFEQWAAAVVGFVEAPRLGLALPLDIRGTAFQLRVWQALQAIPAGETVSYSVLAERIGLPKSARAVAGACAANVLAVAIPCHRVVRADGSLSGYRWGVARKRTLLDREGKG